MEKILITGASSGIGRELAKNLAGRSRKMYLLARSEDKLNLLKKELEEKNSLLECICIKYDLNDTAHLESITENCDVDLVINCAGIGKITDFLKLSDEEDLNTINVNFISPLILTKKFTGGKRNSFKCLFNCCFISASVYGNIQFSKICTAALFSGTG